MFDLLQQRFGDCLRRDEPLARLTSARVGGPADALVEADSAAELAEIVAWCWEVEIPHIVLGGASNVLISDAGIRGLVILNRARQVRFDEGGAFPTVWVESGANFGSLARQACSRGLSGLEWAVGIPGTVGGAVIGNAGAHGSDLASNLLLAEILHHQTYNQPTANAAVQTGPWTEEWPVERFEYRYRSSLLKRQPGQALVLVALLRLGYSAPADTQARAEGFTAQRHRTQPPGASMGSMFKNPPGDYAGRLIEAAGLKGAAVGDAQISPLHANFFINRGQATAADIWGLIQLARRTVAEKSGFELELEIERVGDWRER